MANFRIDEIELNINVSGTYDMVAISNADKTGDYVIDGTITGQELVFDPGTIAGNKRLILRCNGIDFSSYSNQGADLLAICILDYSTIPALKRKKGGVVIVDTEYPPPGGGFTTYHEQFSSWFTITRIFIKRIGTSDEFTVDVTFDYDETQGDYTKSLFEFKEDPIRSGQDVLAFDVNEAPPSTYSVPFSFSVTSVPGKILELKNYSPGLPLIIVNKAATWDYKIDFKKGMIYVE